MPPTPDYTNLVDRLVAHFANCFRFKLKYAYAPVQAALERAEVRPSQPECGSEAATC